MQNMEKKHGNIPEIIDALTRERRPDLIQENGQLNQNAISRETGLSQPTVRKIIFGISREPQENSLTPFANMLGVSIPQLRGQIRIDDIKEPISDAIERGQLGSETILKLLTSTIQIPLYDWLQVKHYYESNIALPSEKDFQLISKDLIGDRPQDYFIVRTPKECRKQLSNADKLIFCTSQAPAPGKKVLCIIGNELEIRIFKRLTSDGEEYSLTSILDDVVDNYKDSNKSNIKAVLYKGVFNEIDL